MIKSENSSGEYYGGNYTYLKLGNESACFKEHYCGGSLQKSLRKLRELIKSDSSFQNSCNELIISDEFKKGLKKDHNSSNLLPIKKIVPPAAQ